jgi:threonine synthase
VRAIRETRGVVAAVSDREILEAKAVIDASGLGCEPASAASVAGVRQLRSRGVIRKGESVVAVLTGHLLKDAETVIRFHDRKGGRRNPPVEIEAKVSAVERLLRRS